MLNVVLDNDVVLGLLANSLNDIQHYFNRLQKSPIRFWLPCCLLASLENQINHNHNKSLSTLLEHPSVELLSSLAAHWYKIPPQSPNKTQALISLDASLLPGTTIIWTHDPDFNSVCDHIEWGDHEFVYSMLAQYDEELVFFDLENQQLAIRTPLEKHLFHVLKKGHYIAGEEIEQLEQQLANFVGAKHCLTVASGTDALLIALMATGIKPNDEVITTPLNVLATAEMIALLGARPVFVDIDPNNHVLNPLLIESAITPNTKAIVVTNLYGQCADFNAINAIAQQYHLSVIEDGAQSFGATYHHSRSGTLGNIGCTSFCPFYPLGAYGEGGACFTNDDGLAEIMLQLRGHGQEKFYPHPVIGINSRLDSLQAAVLLTKLTIFPKELEHRVRVAANYNRLFEGVKGVKIPRVASYNMSTYAQYGVEVNHRDEVRQRLEQQDIPVKVHYPTPIHLQPAFAYLKQGMGSFPVAETIAQQLLNLPMHPYLSNEMQKYVVESVKKALF